MELTKFKLTTTIDRKLSYVPIICAVQTRTRHSVLENPCKDIENRVGNPWRRRKNIVGRGEVASKDTMRDQLFSPQFMRTQMTSASKRNRLGRPSTPPQDVAVWIVSVTRKLVPMPYTMATKERMMTVTTIVIIGETVTVGARRIVFAQKTYNTMLVSIGFLVDDVMSQLQSSRGIIDSLWKSSSSARGVLDSRTLGSTVMMRCCDCVYALLSGVPSPTRSFGGVEGPPSVKPSYIPKGRTKALLFCHRVLKGCIMLALTSSSSIPGYAVGKF
ncbi:hypothetical protein C8Q75DRAFT_865752 [Abortiporus biennis]|nr:hypothetical protein C8Q75DRAFT_865752 [Abortiporus biennis]